MEVLILLVQGFLLEGDTVDVFKSMLGNTQSVNNTQLLLLPCHMAINAIKIAIT